MAFKLVFFSVFVVLCQADSDDKKWVWGENSRNTNSRSYSVDSTKNPNSRYNVFEELDDYTVPRPTQYFPSSQQPFVGQRPVSNYNQRPLIPSPGPLPESRPGGVYGPNFNRPIYRGEEPYQPQGAGPGILTGPVPSWIREGPFKDFDKCKCTEKFNCNSPGISYGHCDVGKQYCCYSTKKDLGGPFPSKPIHSIENGVLVGPGGPTVPLPPVNNYPRPPKHINNGFYGSNQYQGGFGGDYGSRPNFFREPNNFPPQREVLVGPQGSHPGFGLGRSVKANRSEEKAN